VPTNVLLVIGGYLYDRKDELPPRSVRQFTRHLRLIHAKFRGNTSGVTRLMLRRRRDNGVEPEAHTLTVHCNIHPRGCTAAAPHQRLEYALLS
jgi:hypothetical protein